MLFGEGAYAVLGSKASPSGPTTCDVLAVPPFEPHTMRMLYPPQVQKHIRRKGQRVEQLLQSLKTPLRGNRKKELRKMHNLAKSQLSLCRKLLLHSNSKMQELKHRDGQLGAALHQKGVGIEDPDFDIRQIFALSEVQRSQRRGNVSPPIHPDTPLSSSELRYPGLSEDENSLQCCPYSENMAKSFADMDNGVPRQQEGGNTRELEMVSSFELHNQLTGCVGPEESLSGLFQNLGNMCSQSQGIQRALDKEFCQEVVIDSMPAQYQNPPELDYTQQYDFELEYLSGTHEWEAPPQAMEPAMSSATNNNPFNTNGQFQDTPAHMISGHESQTFA